MYEKKRPDGDCTPHTGQKNHNPSRTDKSENTPPSGHNQAVHVSGLPDHWDLTGSMDGVEFVREPSCANCFFYEERAGGAGCAAPFGKVSQLKLDGHVHNVKRIIWIGGSGGCMAGPVSPNERWPEVSSNGWCGKWIYLHAN